MIRVLADLSSGIIGLATVLGFALRRIRKNRRDSNIEHVRQLEQENEEIDRVNRRLTGGR